MNDNTLDSQVTFIFSETNAKIKLDKTPFARSLQHAAKQKGMTQEFLAEKINKSKNTVAQMFTSQRFTSIPTLISICNVLEITPNYLLSSYIQKSNNNAEDTYFELLNSIRELKPNEIYIILGIIELMINNRDR